ncbi:blastopia polyprotein [Nephila pilipes]|uniref:Blastopia polyprotein n=1 Tax=Nephila pilipes TaxID=299642 RepID=A0A8X6UA22_NEPPI|nr:blastopia polyprotein [Nephila pilipes]
MPSIVRAPNDDFKPKNKYYGYKHENNSNIKCFNCNLWGHKSAECKNKKDGLKCLKCSKFGHIAKFCDQTDINQTLVTRSNTFTKKLEKIVEIQGVKINALFDTGSELSLISYESYIKIGSPKLSFNNVSFAGINQECLSPLGFFFSDIKFDKCCIATEIYVIQKLCCDIIIGLDVINKLNITINENGIEIAGKRNTFHASYATINFNRVPTHKTSPNNIKHITSVFRLAPCVGSEPNANNEVNVQPVVTINPNAVHTRGKTADVEEIEYFFNLAKAINLDEVDLSHIIDQDIKHNLKQVLDTYTPQKRKTTDVMMKIVLTDESPIHSKPRRLAANEKTFVDSQIQNCCSYPDVFVSDVDQAHCEGAMKVRMTETVGSKTC